MNILRGRNLVWMIGMPIFFTLIWLGGYFFYALIQIVIFLVIREFNILAKRLNTNPSLVLLTVSSVFISFYYFSGFIVGSYKPEIYAISTSVILFFYELFNKKENSFLNISMTIFGIFYIPIMLGTIIAIRQFDHDMHTSYTYALFISIWACDTSAFIFGSYFGKRKIFPSISPKKTWEGSIAGVISSVAIFVLFSKLNLLGNSNNFNEFISLGILVSVFGQIGDLFESKLKREAGVKDSGTLLLGHGGVLDRFDSLIFASPVIYFYTVFFI